MTRNFKLKKPDETKDVGRPSKFTPERRAAIINDIVNRIPYQLAAEANGICESTLYDWLNTAKVHQMEGIDSDFTEFSESIKKAERNKIKEHTSIIASRPKQWQADAWILERRWPKYFGTNILLQELNQRFNQMQGSSHVEQDEDIEERG